jgi:tRNA (mo5U34)-methyltransferase
MIDVGEMAVRAREFATVLDRAREKAAGPSTRWYPFPMLPAMAEILDSLLTGSNRHLLDLAGGLPVADVGGADGDFSFFLESLGCDVDLIDHARTKQAGLRPAEALKEALESTIAIHDIDVDHAFTLPRTYGLVFVMGILYHLRNPFIVLETLAQSVPYCVFSTKIARHTGIPRFGRRRGVDVADVPMAYLLDTRECNNDPTNFWVFTESGLRRILSRTGWTVLDYTSVGARETSTPMHSPEERAWVLAKSERLGSGS